MELGHYRVKEYGSEYHWLPFSHKQAAPSVKPGTLLFSNGRAALVTLLNHGMKTYGWKQIWMPQYFCPEVVQAIKNTGIDVRYYSDTPLDAAAVPLNIGSGDVIYITNHFGLKTAEHYSLFYSLNAPIIEDHTHDPWSPWASSSRADFALASYRKVLPIPDGAGLWSPKGIDITGYLEAREAEIADKLQAMLLKSLYLSQGLPVKEDYLSLFRKHEADLAGCCSRISLLSEKLLTYIPWKEWREKRKRNFSILEANFLQDTAVQVARPEQQGCCPYSFILLFKSNRKREQVRLALMQRAVYPAILWSMPRSDDKRVEKHVIDLSERMLSIHIDGRYTEQDMLHIATVLREVM